MRSVMLEYLKSGGFSKTPTPIAQVARANLDINMIGSDHLRDIIVAPKKCRRVI